MYRRSGRGRLLLVVFLALCTALITLDFREGEGGPLDKAKDVSAAVIDPIQRGFATVFRPVGDFFSSVGELSNLRGENSRLEAENAEMRERIEQADSIASENVRLRTLLALDKSWASMERVSAQVISRPSSNYQWYLTIDRGSSHEIHEDMAVITADGLVGKIIEAEPNSATVRLLIDSKGAAAAQVVEARATGSVTGNGAGEPLTMDFVDPDAKVEVGDEVVTSYYNGGIYPPNIPIGRVSHVGVESASVDQDIEVEPYADFTSLDFVFVLIESGPKLKPPKGDER
jgi:rod shape-determining protein MreC